MRTVLALACILTAAALPAAQSGHLIERDRLAKTHACDGCDLRSEDFGRADLKGVSLAGARLDKATFYRANLENANLAGATLTDAVLSFANLTNTHLHERPSTPA